jgi:hypothetical protein
VSLKDTESCLFFFLFLGAWKERKQGGGEDDGSSVVVVRGHSARKVPRPSEVVCVRFPNLTVEPCPRRLGTHGERASVAAILRYESFGVTIVCRNFHLVE